ncbi:Phosphatidylcholine-hydrolyzing phospholipase [Mycena venus]|uniref:Phosphatidylcholine-hydrolyzing phospholipase n=1 Tax=Mycena venus TaxID=2733690 RepID=A0A8H6X6S7_9AGAR|nr:Phosphatidylcholine-hydrolyzing phospholipase [Mycena venus]
MDMPKLTSTVTMAHAAGGKADQLQHTVSEHASTTDATGGKGDSQAKTRFESEVVELTPTTNAHGKAVFSEASTTNNTFEAAGPDSVRGGPQYYGMAAEHASIGDLVELQLDTGIIKGKDFKYPAGPLGDKILSYGHIVALAGDFYGNFQLVGDAEQLSDNLTKDTSLEDIIKRADGVAGTLSNDTRKYLGAVLATMGKEKNEVDIGLKAGKDAAQIFAKIGKDYDEKYESDTKIDNFIPGGAYALLAHCNWDHFGKDAQRAYGVVHIAALFKAKEANDAHNRKKNAEETGGKYDGPTPDRIMQEAYFLEAYAQHFLTDLFSSGHLRTPRRALHGKLEISEALPSKLPLSEAVYALDFTAKRMHDEDCANGLWVRNSKGQGWAVYGDKQILSAKSNENFRRALIAAQAGLDEVWETRKTGESPKNGKFAALELTPKLDDELKWRNFCPLFWISDGILYKRRALENRSDFSESEYNAQFKERIKTLEEITDSGPQTKMYPWSQGFISQTSFVHLRVAPSTKPGLLESWYGPLKTEGRGSTWTMVNQFHSPLKLWGGEIWVSAAALTSDVRILVARVTQEDGWHHRHVGIQADSVKWELETKEGNFAHFLTDVLYGNFSSDPAPTQIGMIKYSEKFDGSGGRIDTWYIDAPYTQPPKEVSAFVWDTPTLLSFLLSHKLHSTDTYQTFVGFGKGTLYFATYSKGYTAFSHSWVTLELKENPNLLKYTIFAVVGVDTDPVNRPTGSGPAPRPLMFVTVNGDRMKFDFLSFTREKGKLQLSASSVVEYPIIWRANTYLGWFFAASKVITLGMQSGVNEASLVVVVFPWNNIKVPVVSKISLSTDKGSLLSAPFMVPVRTMLTSYTYPDGNTADGEIIPGETTDSAIIMFFDNYGILGARVLAPKKNAADSEYELKGQIPAIAGQAVNATGWNKKVGTISENISVFQKDVKFC